jgi:cellulose biosynthesis protein BcsQ
MKILASYNIKGGVGKTATTVNLAHHAAQRGARTLVWDLDPQGASSFYFRVKPKVKGGFSRLLLRHKRPERAIRGTDFEGLDILPADFSARHIDIVLDRTKRPTRKLRRMMKRLAKEYDLLVLDCAPSIGVASDTLFDVADLLLVPTIPTTLSLNTLTQLKKHLKQRKGKAPKVLPFFSMVDDRKKLHRQICEKQKGMAYPALKTRIPYSSVIEKMGTHRAPVAAYAKGSKAAKAYARLGDEVLRHLR